MARPAGMPAAGGGFQACLGRGDTARSLLYIFPLFLIYGVGVLVVPVMNGADFVTRHVFAAVGNDKWRYLAVQLLLAIMWTGGLYGLKRRGVIKSGHFGTMLVESAVYALTLGSLILFVMDKALGFLPGLSFVTTPELIAREFPVLASPAKHGPISILVLSAGAGLYEELVFRLGLFACGTWLLKAATGMRHSAALAIALVLSSVVFSWVHHLGPLGDPFQMSVFVYRALAGIVFGLIFYFRSLAHAVYAHFLYDVYVLMLR